jgi:hypothetical protein
VTEKALIRRRLLEALYPRRARADFLLDPDHNPLVLEDCAPCHGTGQICREGPASALLDVCDSCEGCGWSGRLTRYFSEDSEAPRRAQLSDEWLTCPSCKRRFTVRDTQVWTGFRHIKCGARIALTPNDAGPWILESADILRDGGSYVATLVRGTRTVTLLLRVKPWDKPGHVEYGPLYVTAGQQFQPRGARVPPLGERRWCDALSEGLANTSSSSCVERARELIERLDSRGPKNEAP